jgi:hypothetical protein
MVSSSTFSVKRIRAWCVSTVSTKTRNIKAIVLYPWIKLSRFCSLRRYGLMKKYKWSLISSLSGNRKSQKVWQMCPIHICRFQTMYRLYLRVWSIKYIDSKQNSQRLFCRTIPGRPILSKSMEIQSKRQEDLFMDNSDQ